MKKTTGDNQDYTDTVRRELAQTGKTEEEIARSLRISVGEVSRINASDNIRYYHNGSANWTVNKGWINKTTTH